MIESKIFKMFATTKLYPFTVIIIMIMTLSLAFALAGVAVGVLAAGGEVAGGVPNNEFNSPPEALGAGCGGLLNSLFGTPSGKHCPCS